MTLIVIVTCYLLMFRAAYNVHAQELRESYRRAVCTAGIYILRFFVQMLPMFCALAMSTLDKIDQNLSHLILVVLNPVPALVNAAVPLYYIKEFKLSLLSLCRRREDQLPDVQMREIRLRRGRAVTENGQLCN